MPRGRYDVVVRCALLALLAACAGTPRALPEPPPPAAPAPSPLPAPPLAPPASAPSPPPPLAPRPLGMNDVSILLPLPRDVAAPVLATADALVDRSWFDALVTAHHDIAPRNGDPVGFADFHVVALRFDLCERLTIGPCPDGVSGRLRLVLQPLYTAAGEIRAHDIALHAFYAVPAGELAAFVDELRALARIQDAPAGAPLGVSPAAAAGNPTYLARLHALTVRYARADNLERLTVIGQQAESAAFSWVFRGLERAGTAIAPVPIPGVAAAEQSMMLTGGDTIYRIDQLVDQPSGFALATNGARFAAATLDQRTASLEALAAVQNPALHDTINTQCIACHVATFLTARRSATSGIDPVSPTSRFRSPYDVSVRSIAASDSRVVRAFGWAASFPAISQRVANDTAQVLSEIEARFPARRP